jgi:hypothetical protein
MKTNDEYLEKLNFLYRFEVLGASGGNFYKTFLLSRSRRNKFAVVQQLEDGNKLIIGSHIVKSGGHVPHESALWRVLGVLLALSVYPMPWKKKMKGQYNLVRRGVAMFQRLLHDYGKTDNERGALLRFLLYHEACFAVWYDREKEEGGDSAIEPMITFLKERDRVLASMDITRFDVKKALPEKPKDVSLREMLSP